MLYFQHCKKGVVRDGLFFSLHLFFGEAGIIIFPSTEGERKPSQEADAEKSSIMKAATKQIKSF